MNINKLLAVAAALILVVTFAACQKKQPEPETAASAVTEPVPVEEPTVVAPTEAGDKPLETPAEVAKVQVIDALTYTISVVGWDNPFAITMCDRILGNVKVLSGAAADDNEKSVLAKAEVDVNGVKGKLSDAVKSKKPLTQEEISALQGTLKQTRADLKGLYRPNLILTEAVGDKIKEGIREREAKEKEGGDMKKEKVKEGGDALKEKLKEGSGGK